MNVQLNFNFSATDRYLDMRYKIDEPTVTQLSKNFVIFALLSGHLHVQCLEKKIRNKLKLKKVQLATGPERKNEVITCSRKFKKISIYCSLDKENVLNEIMKVSHVSYHVLNSNFNLLMSDIILTEDKTLKLPHYHHRHLHYGFNFAGKL